MVLRRENGNFSLKFVENSEEIQLQKGLFADEFIGVIVEGSNGDLSIITEVEKDSNVYKITTSSGDAYEYNYETGMVLRKGYSKIILKFAEGAETIQLQKGIPAEEFIGASVESSDGDLSIITEVEKDSNVYKITTSSSDAYEYNYETGIVSVSSD